MKKNTHFEENRTAKFTILEAGTGLIQTKRFHKEGVDSSSRAKTFVHQERQVSCFEDLHSLIIKLSNSACKVVVAGTVKDEFRLKNKIRRLANPRHGEAPTLEDLGCGWLNFDIDEVERPDHLSWRDPQALAEWTWDEACRRLPPLKNVSVVWQASSSAGTAGKELFAKFHFYCLADRPLFAHERQHLFKLAGSDTSLARIAQPNYIATPVFDGVLDPLEGLPRIGIIRKDKESLNTSSIAFPEEAKGRKRKTKQGNPSKPLPLKAYPSSAKTITSKRGEVQLSKSCAKLGRGGHGNTTIYNEALLIGGFVSAGEINEWEAHERLLKAASQTGHDRYQEALRNGFRDGLARPIVEASGAEGPGPFYPHSSIPRDQAISMHAETIESWGNEALAFLCKQSQGMSWQENDGPPRVLLSGAQGIGKTSALVGRNGQPGFLHRTEGLVSLMLLPDHEKVIEAFDDYQKNATASAPPTIALKGRNRRDPEADNDTVKMCRVYPTARKLSDLGFSIRSTLCKKCPFRTDCGYLRQEAEIKLHLKAKTGLVIFAPHEYGHLPLPAEALPDLTVFDERPRDFGVEEVHVSLVELTATLMSPAKNWKQRVVEIGDALLLQDQAIFPVKSALLAMAGDAPGIQMDRLREMGVTSELLRAAIKHLEELKTGNTNRALKPLFSCKDDVINETQLGIIGSRLKSCKASHARRLQTLCECLLVDMENNLATSSAVFVHLDQSRPAQHQAGFSAVRLRDLKNVAHRPFLYLDGTANADMSRLLLGSDLETRHYPVARNAKVTQVVGCNFSKRRLSLAAQEKQTLTAKIRDENDTLRGYVNGVIARHPEAAVFGTKDVIASLDFDRLGRAGHFGKLRGQNRWEQFDQAIVIGREQPGYLDVERIARAYASAAREEFQSGDYVKQRRGIRMRNGSHEMDVFAHRDPWGDRVLQQIREAEIEQAMDRVRLIHNSERKEVFLMSPVVANVTVDRIVEWRDFKKGGSNVDKAIAKHGLLFLSPTDCAKHLPEIWRSKQAAQNDLKRAKLLSKEPYRDILYGELDGKSPPLLVEFWPAVEKGRRSRKKQALVFAPVYQVREKLEQFVNISEFRVLSL
ncbi:hypothetical protein [Tateyamaria sp. Alg231-49]|uniref:hypothetical protein n=1 Tax=Tateyamaria sp. Alg231-49 TaxID=1922219 RepID=UPI000D5576A0|nr:hypothetical protein [Tateyamaria sp. Alg231-49]